jgi:hypothetical protein
VTRYESPSRPRSAEWTAAMAWWRSLDQSLRLNLLRQRGLRSCVAIVAYWRWREARHG